MARLTERENLRRCAAMEVITSFLENLWMLLAEMSPYLLLGFIIAGLLRVFFKEDWVQKHLGQKGFYQTVKAVVIGIPLPLCSCGVIPVAASIRRQGGQRGAVASFTAATPQTGVDAVAASVGMLGWVFTIARVVIAFINGIITGMLVDRFGEKDEDDTLASSAPRHEKKSCCCESKPDSEMTSCCGAEKKQENESVFKRVKSGLSFGLITLPADLFSPLLIGILIAAGISTIAPAGFFESIPGGQIGLYAAVTLISLPLYVCSTGSIPMAFSFLHSGMSPGAVMLFLIAGPATNVATITSLWKLIGKRSTILYVASIMLVGWISALVIDLTGLSFLINHAVHSHEMKISFAQHLSAVFLIAVLLYACFMPQIKNFSDRRKRGNEMKQTKDCCHH